MNKEIILVVDFRGQDAQYVGRKLRELGYYSEIYSYKNIKDKLNDKIIALVLVGNKRSGKKDQLEYIKNSGLEYLDLANTNFSSWDEKLDEFTSQLDIDPNWSIKLYKDYAIEELKNKLGDAKVLLGLSGGVDSSVCAKLISEAVGDNLTCILVDHGLMRKNEIKEIQNAFSNSDLNLILVDAKDRFLSKLQGVTNPEEKRKIIGEEFIRVFEDQAKDLGSVDYLAQGTIYSDVVESGDDELAIKSHHNVGGLPDVIEFKDIIEPLRMLFKDEVRELGELLGLDHKLVWRQPFPGPGLAIRIIGEVTNEKLSILKDADYIFREEIAKAGLSKEYNQFFAVLTNIKTVGARDGKRTYDYILALRAIETIDFMTGEFAKIPYQTLETVSNRICLEVDGINRVVYDITDKPPATIEWE